jgi:hypothetical protein
MAANDRLRATHTTFAVLSQRSAPVLYLLCNSTTFAAYSIVASGCAPVVPLCPTVWHEPSQDPLHTLSTSCDSHRDHNVKAQAARAGVAQNVSACATEDCPAGTLRQART